MIVHGREVNFRLTVGAQIELCKLCPGEDISRLGELVGEDKTVRTLETLAKMAAILSKADADARDYEGESVKPLTYEEALTLKGEEFQAMEKEAMAAFHADGKPTVEAKPAKNAEAGAAESEA